MSINPLSELYELAQAPIAPITDIDFHSWQQITTPPNQVTWQGQLSVRFLDHGVTMQIETVKTEGSKKKAVQQELAGKMLAKISETFKRPNNYIPTFVRNVELAPKLPRTPQVQVEAIPYIGILKDRSSSREKRDMAEAWLKENFDPEIWNAET